MEAKPALGERLLEERQTGSSSHLLLMDNWLRLTPFILVLQIENSTTSAILRPGSTIESESVSGTTSRGVASFLKPSKRTVALWTAS